MRININNREKVEEALEKAQATAKTRILDYGDIFEGVEDAEERLSIMPKKFWRGAKVWIQPHRVPNAYKHAAYSTYACLVRGAKDWFLVSTGRSQIANAPFGTPLPPRVYVKVPENGFFDMFRAILNKHKIDFV